MNRELISVVVPVYRGLATLKDSLESVVAQTGVNSEIIVVDDGSPDDSYLIAEEMAAGQAAVKFRIHRQQNKGLAATLNFGIGLASSGLISRLDQDDLMLPGRLAAQLNYMREHEDCALLGTWSQIYEKNFPSKRFHTHPVNSDAIKLFLFFDNPFVHSSVMIRKSAFEQVGGYTTDPGRQPPEDYELWSRLARDFPVANIPQVLTVYREFPGSMSRDAGNPFLPKVLRISAENIHHHVSDVYSLDECMVLSKIFHLANEDIELDDRGRSLEIYKLAVSRLAASHSTLSDEFHEMHRVFLAHLTDRCSVRHHKKVKRRVRKAARKAFRNRLRLNIKKIFGGA